MITRLFLTLLVLVSIAAFGEARAADLLARFSLVAYDPVNDKTVLLVRAVLDGDDTACPPVTIDGVEVAMTPRANPDTTRFPVSVCEAVAQLGSAVSVGDAVMPTLAGYDGGDLRVVVLGDTGCKGGSKQDCATAWPFAGIASGAAAEAPDLVLHVGDWDYLGTPSTDAAGQRVYDACLPADGGPLVSLAGLSDWSTWRDDALTAAAPLFEAAPWIVTRGNHELCSRAGQGWFFLLDPHSTLLDAYHAEPSCDAPSVLTLPYPLHVGGLTVIVADDVNACDNEEWQSEAAWAYQTRLLAPMIDRVAQMAKREPGPVWLATHKPLWGAIQHTQNGPIVDGTLAWRLALRASLDGALPANVALLVSGHIHDAQALVFDGDRPPQLIVGNGGTALDENYLERPVSVEIVGMAATGWINSTPGAEHGFGYLSIEVSDAADWRGRMPAYRPDGTPAGVDLMACAMPVRDGKLCSPP